MHHLATQHLAGHRRHRRAKDIAFVREPGERHGRAPDDLAEILAVSYIAAALSGEEQTEEALNDFVIEELGGPFVQDDLRLELPAEAIDRPSPWRRTTH